MNATPVANTIYYSPFLVLGTIKVVEVLCRIQTASTTTGAKNRIAIYNADENWKATSLVLDCGEISVDSTGAKSITINQTLNAGRYLTRLHTDGSASQPIHTTMRGSLMTGSFLNNNDQLHHTTLASRTYGVAEDPGTALDIGTGAGSSTGTYVNYVRMKTETV